MNCLPLMISHEWNHAESRDARSIWRFHTLRKKSQLFEDLNAYWCLCFLLVNKVKMEQIMFTKNRESAFWKKGMFCDGELQRSVKISHGSENFSFCCWATPIIIIITLLPIHLQCMVLTAIFWESRVHTASYTGWHLLDLMR